MVTLSGKAGMLYVVATPIGNLEDISARALRVLAEVELVLAEDTRHSGKLLHHFGITTPLESLHEHNERAKVAGLVARLSDGARMALVSDAGTPLISDPGYPLVAAARQAGINAIPVPGPSALMAALSVSGLPADRFTFEGFLPARSPARRRRLTELVDWPHTLAFFESSHRITDSLRDMAEIFGDPRQAFVAREITKRFESLRQGGLRTLVEWVEQDPDQQRGEFVVLVAPAQRGAPSPGLDARFALELLLEELPPARAARIAARLTGENRQDLYRLAETLKTGPKS